MSAGAQLQPSQLQNHYAAIRAVTLGLCAPLAVEDHVVQTMPDVSPPKWHLAHTTWFFETFVLQEYCPAYQPVQAHYRRLFNAYYVRVGASHPRAERGLLSRPTLAEVHDYRRAVDGRLLEFLDDVEPAQRDEVQRRVLLGSATSAGRRRAQPAPGCAGSSTTAACTISATTARASPTTTSRPATRRS